MMLEFCVHTRCWSRVPVFKRANSLASASSVSVSTTSSLFGSSTAGANSSSSQPPAAQLLSPLGAAIGSRWEAHRAERQVLSRSLRSLAQQREMTPTPTPTSTSTSSMQLVHSSSVSLASPRSASQPPESHTALEASLSSTTVREESPEAGEVAATSSFIRSISVSTPKDTVEDLGARDTARAIGLQSKQESGTDSFSTDTAPLVAAQNSAQSSRSTAPKPSASAPAGTSSESQAVDVKPKVEEEEEEEPDIGSTNLLPVLALMGQGIAAAANEREQVVFISGQMRSYTAPTNAFHLKNRCYRLRLVSSSSLYNHSSKSIYPHATIVTANAVLYMSYSYLQY